jgi:hypothetical protein
MKDHFGAATAAQAGRLHLVDNPVDTLAEEELRSIPGAAHLRSLQVRRVDAVEVGEDAIFVGKRHNRILSALRRDAGRRIRISPDGLRIRSVAAVTGV